MTSVVLIIMTVCGPANEAWKFWEPGSFGYGVNTKSINLLFNLLLFLNEGNTALRNAPGHYIIGVGTYDKFKENKYLLKNFSIK